jgi:hypothetical protein
MRTLLIPAVGLAFALGLAAPTAFLCSHDEHRHDPHHAFEVLTVKALSIRRRLIIARPPRSSTKFRKEIVRLVQLLGFPGAGPIFL